MKVKVLSLLVPALLVAGAANAAEIYNKDGNKLDLYGKIDGLHYFSDDKSVDGDQTYMRVGVKGETQINDQLTGYGQWEYNVQANNTESSSDLKYVDVGATYYFNKNMSTYVDYKINLLDDNSFTRNAGISTDDVVALGLVYQF
ncbi:TPA: porin [Klebsiella pneumoniae]|nr:porin [Klebsiella pneumoniae]